MKLTITGVTKAENDQMPEVHLATINSGRPEVIGRVILECLFIVQKEPNLCDAIEVRESGRSN